MTNILFAGRVLNRFAKDCGIIDETLPPTLFDTMEVKHISMATT
jgi:hypothetical protein